MEKYATNHEAFLTKFKSQCDEREAGSCCCSVAKSCPTLWDPWTAAHQASLSLTISQSLPKFTSIESVMPSNYLILCYPLLLRPSIFPSIRVFSNESVLCTRWSKYWSFSFSISPSNEYSGLSSVKIDWFNLLPVKGTLKNLLQHHNSKVSILQHSGFFMVQLSHSYMTKGKTIALTIQIFASKVMSLLFNTYHLLISWLQSLSSVILEPKKIKSVTVSTVSLFYLPCQINDLSFLNAEF